MSAMKVLPILPPPYSVQAPYAQQVHYILPQPQPPRSTKSFSFSVLQSQAKPAKPRHRSLSLRSKGSHKSGGDTGVKHKFGLLRASTKPELSKKLARLIKSENHIINSADSAGREQISIASQLSEWGLATNDDGVSDISDKIGVLLSELGETEIRYGQGLEDYRATLKHIRNTEASVQPSRDNKTKITDEIARLKYKEPQSTKIPLLEQELVRAEAENLVAEAQLTNVTRQKLKEAYAVNFAAIIERAEKQIILAKQGRRLLNVLDDTPVVPGDVRPTYDLESEARQILNDAETELQSWSLNLEEVTSNAHLDSTLMPQQNMGAASHMGAATGTVPHRTMSGSSTSSSEYAAAPASHQTVLHGTHPLPATETNTTAPVGVSGAVQQHLSTA